MCLSMPNPSLELLTFDWICRMHRMRHASVDHVTYIRIWVWCVWSYTWVTNWRRWNGRIKISFVCAMKKIEKVNSLFPLFYFFFFCFRANGGDHHICVCLCVFNHLAWNQKLCKLNSIWLFVSRWIGVFGKRSRFSSIEAWLSCPPLPTPPAYRVRCSFYFLGSIVQMCHGNNISCFVSLWRQHKNSLSHWANGRSSMFIFTLHALHSMYEWTNVRCMYYNLVRGLFVLVPAVGDKTNRKIKVFFTLFRRTLKPSKKVKSRESQMHTNTHTDV